MRKAKLVVILVMIGAACASSGNLDAFDYPPPSSPGATNTAVTQANIHPTATTPGTICVPGWTATIRPSVSYTNKVKKEDMAAEGITAPKSAFELDHIVPLELGGNPTDRRNLFPQPWNGAHGARA